jgi:peptide/nickel transport system substrate-binding protein
VLTKYDDYWSGWEEGQFTKLVFILVEDETVREQMIRSGEVDMTFFLPFDSHEALEATGEITIDPAAQFTNEYIYFHLDNPPMDDIRVRQALIYAFPYEAVQGATWGGKGTLAKGIAPASLWDPPASMGLTQDLEKAQAFLDEAGVEDGLEVVLAIGTGDVNNDIYSQLWQADLAKIGVDLKIEPITVATWWDAAYNPDNEYHAFGTTWAPGYASAFEFGIMYHSAYTLHPASGYSSEVYDAQLLNARSTEVLDVAESNKLYAEAFKTLYDDAVAVFMVDTPWDFHYRNDIVGFEPNPPYFDLVFWYDMRRE